MKTIILLLTVATLGSTLGVAQDPGLALTGGLGDGPLGALIATIGNKGPIRASFTERRFFPIRKEPTVLSGIIRISQERGLSLAYTRPEPLILIADPWGLIMRDARGRDRQVPVGSREAGAIGSLLPIMGFDLSALAAHFDIRALGGPQDWRLEFRPKDPGAPNPLGTIIVDGAFTEVTRIEFRRSSNQRIEIEVHDTQTGVVFTPEEVRRYFRTQRPR